ncbi:MAG: hypothetical protein ACREQO_08120, partial [Candidatus Binatia bacterium]
VLKFVQKPDLGKVLGEAAFTIRPYSFWRGLPIRQSDRAGHSFRRCRFRGRAEVTNAPFDEQVPRRIWLAPRQTWEDQG